MVIDIVAIYKKLIDVMETLATNCNSFLVNEYDYGIFKISGWDIVLGSFIICLAAYLVKKFVPLA